MSFTAQFSGECTDCLGAIHPGQGISRNADGTYRHATCPTPGLTVVDLAPGEKPCGGCQLVEAITDYEQRLDDERARIAAGGS